ncbi:hypothetical protein Q5H92_09200 [Hymenobacter sp. M29]|uniref:Carboxypeptidase regulatory-like domain-containing protein n=1 Tax=Hymenobacter mellowenesis TaxID=3063995 RepID=A0ABT9ABH2_9BACT|nr:hypothetical protein [Hymenobacter sp. M29]MDO7846530.1 hypothetical protein [Hymenobacter sp. M29]
MNRSLSLRSAQQLTGATTTTSAQRLASAPFLRPLLLGGLAVLGTVGSALAQDAPSVKAKQADAQSLWLTVENPTQQRMHMDVVCLSNKTSLVSETNRRASYGSQLSFKGLPAGQYAVLLRVGRERYRYNVDVKADAQTAISVRELMADKTSELVASATR